ncbi:cytochrome P450 6A1 [Lophiotrema nucula]|uniref:Cytochrome P450 6A1 n=1 Tax=Lophiotrema nucula TaxID=690887 RepID=A0A6A5Z3Q0_9PLEO|nr:cytochrome P450 6A1 [Lophiotrema nucula]
MTVMDTFNQASTPPIILFLAFVVVLFTAYVVLHSYARRMPSNAPPLASGNWPLTGSIEFWTRRWDWYQSARRTATGNFSFHAGKNPVVGLSGDKSRQLFVESKELGFAEGYAVLFGAAPKVKAHDDGVAEGSDLDKHFHKRLTALLKNDQFRKKLPTLISDVQETIEAIRNDPSGITNPFESLYRVIFKMTIRVVGAEEIVESPELLEKTLNYFHMIDASSTATTVMFPKLPSPAILRRTYAGARLYMMVEKIVKQRAESGEKHDDPLQYLLDQGDRTYKIIEFMVGALFAGLLNSGINAAWVMCYMATSPEWTAKCREEVRQVAAKYTKSPNAPLYRQLDDVPLEAWESEFPVVDLCLKDSIRLNLLGTAFRKNTSGRAIPTGNGNEVIPPDAFVTYATADVHHDPSIYPKPERWDPSRYLSEEWQAQSKARPYTWMGWGVARHPCLGMRFAKLEQNLITAYFLAAFDMELQDQNGRKLNEHPLTDFNRFSAHKPDPPIYLKVDPREK